MSVALGQVFVYLKIGVLAFAIMGAVWLLVRWIEAKGRRNTTKSED